MAFSLTRSEQSRFWRLELCRLLQLQPVGGLEALASTLMSSKHLLHQRASQGNRISKCCLLCVFAAERRTSICAAQPTGGTAGSAEPPPTLGRPQPEP